MPKKRSLAFGACVGGVTAGVLMSGVAVPSALAVPAAPSGDAQVHSTAGKVISGKVKGGGGMTLLALHSSGQSTKTTLSSNGSFRVAGSTGTSLHLISSDGSYFGPVVLRGNKSKYAKSRLVYESVRGSGKLKLGTIKRGQGFAATKKMVSRRHVIAAVTSSAAAVAGKPIGSGKLGLVNVAKSSSLLSGPIRPALDNDRDGLPSAFDIDDNGNLILDNVDRTQRTGTLSMARAAEVGSASWVSAADITTDGFRMFSNYKSTSPDFSDVINVNVAVPSAEALDESVRTKTTMAVQVIPGATLSCSGQVYCPAAPMPIVAGGTGDFQWHVADTYPALKAGDIAAGDTFVETVGTSNYPGVLNFTFLTTPALKGYTILDSGGAEVSSAVVDWSAPNKAGSASAPIAVNVASGQKVKLEFWRPQRPAVVGETGATDGYIDIGGLTYSADAHPGFCAATAGDSSGQTTPDGPSTAVLDLAGDGTPSVDRTFSMIVDLSTCSTNDVDIQAKSLFGDNSAQKIFFTRS